MVPGFSVKSGLCSGREPGIPQPRSLPPPATQSRQSPSTQPCEGPLLWTQSPLKGSSASLNKKSSISFLSLPTRVPISANNNIHINRFLDHSHQNTRDSWQEDLLPCHHLPYLLGTRWEILAIPSFTSALHTVESSCDFKLSFSGVDWQKRSCHHRICF